MQYKNLNLTALCSSKIPCPCLNCLIAISVCTCWEFYTLANVLEITSLCYTGLCCNALHCIGMNCPGMHCNALKVFLVTGQKTSRKFGQPATRKFGYTSGIQHLQVTRPQMAAQPLYYKEMCNSIFVLQRKRDSIFPLK